jgi:hypothetical protein
MKALRVALLCAAVAACSRGQVSTLAEPASHSEWSATLVQASTDASAGRYGVADRVLSDYATRYPASPDAAEALYWRAMYRLDPANQSASPREAAAMLDSYLGVSGVPHRAEAQALRRIAGALERREQPAAGNTSAAPKPDAAPDKAKDDEIQRLKDELSKANAELERIKRRLAQPKP